MLKSAQNCKKCAFLYNLRTITQEGTWKLEKWPHLFIYLFHSKIIVTFILVFENSQNSFSCGPSFGSLVPLWPIWTAHHTFLVTKHPEATKNHYYVLILEGSQKKYQLMDYMWWLNCMCYKFICYALFACGHCFFQYEFI